jgi:hypothetical protein
MHLSRLLLLSLMLPVCVLPVAAQSAANPGAATAAPQLQWLTPPADSRTRIPILTMKAPGEAAGSQGQFSLGLNKPAQSQIMSSRLLQRTSPGFNPDARRTILIAGLLLAQKRLNLSQNPSAGPGGTCYSMRNYRFERDSPATDSTSFKDYSTCQSAAQFQAKTIVSSGMIPVR